MPPTVCLPRLYLVSEGGWLHQMKRLSVHFNDAIALATVSNCCGRFLRMSVRTNVISQYMYTVNMRTHLSAKDLDTWFGCGATLTHPSPERNN